MADSLSRRNFLTAAGAAFASGSLLSQAGCASAASNAPGSTAAHSSMPTDHGPNTATVQNPRAGIKGLPFRISLAQWSLHRELAAKKSDNLDFARIAREDYGIEAIEYVNTNFKAHAEDPPYLAEMNRRAKDHGVFQHLIMCDGEGRLGDPDAAKRMQAVDNHRKWLHAAHELGCITIRVNAASEGSYEEQQKLAADGLHHLVLLGAEANLNVIVENHGGLSSNGKWLAGVMKMIDHPRAGTLPDFGNFNLGNGLTYDRYVGVAELMPYAKAASAKTHDFDDTTGEETTKDYHRLMKIVMDNGFHSWVGIEYEGDRLPEREGIARSLTLLKKVREELK